MSWLAKLRSKLPETERRIIFRFIKQMSEHKRELRKEIGSIIAKNAADGVLKSGFTVKKSYEAMDNHLARAIDECLELISKKTDHAGKMRSTLLIHLRKQVRLAADVMNTMIEESVFNRVGISGSAYDSADALCRRILEARLDQVDKYDDGLTAPEDKKWHTRHPILVGGLGALIATIIVAIAARISGLLE